MRVKDHRTVPRNGVCWEYPFSFRAEDCVGAHIRVVKGLSKFSSIKGSLSSLRLSKHLIIVLSSNIMAMIIVLT